MNCVSFFVWKSQGLGVDAYNRFTTPHHSTTLTSTVGMVQSIQLVIDLKYLECSSIDVVITLVRIV